MRVMGFSRGRVGGWGWGCLDYGRGPNKCCRIESRNRKSVKSRGHSLAQWGQLYCLQESMQVVVGFRERDQTVREDALGEGQLELPGGERHLP